MVLEVSRIHWQNTEGYFKDTLYKKCHFCWVQGMKLHISGEIKCGAACDRHSYKAEEF